MASVAIIGAGQIGFAAASAFVGAGHSVSVYARSAPEWSVEGARFQPYVVGKDAPPSFHVVVDTIAYDADDIARYDPNRIGHLITISSASVYRDAMGRTLDEAATNGFPAFPDPIDEQQQTVAPGPETYSTRKVRMERQIAVAFGSRGTVLRPGAIHGAHSRHPREWWFVKRLLDGREVIPLAFRGESRFGTTAADTIGEAVLFCAERSLGGTFNVTDADAPNVTQIGEAIAGRMGRKARFLPIDADPRNSALGRTPFSIPAPMVTSASALEDEGFAGARPYHVSVGPAVDDLAGQTPQDWREALPQLAQYPWNLFDYAKEDAAL